MRKSEIFVLVRGLGGFGTRGIYFETSPADRQYCYAYGQPPASPRAHASSGTLALECAVWPENRISGDHRRLAQRPVGFHERSTFLRNECVGHFSLRRFASRWTARSGCPSRSLRKST